MCRDKRGLGGTDALVPVGIGEGNLLAKGLEGFCGFFAAWLLLLYSLDSGWCWLGGWSRWFCLGLRLGLCVEGSDLQLPLVFLENAFVVVLPECLGGILACYALEDFLAACLGRMS